MIASPKRVVVALACLLTAGCTAGAPPPDPAGPTVQSSRAASSSGTGTPGDGQRSTGEFTVEFAKCMRANGVPNFPDPTGTPGQLGPDSGVDPGAPAYLAALNGPCRSLAPPAWVDSGPGTAG